MSRKIINQLLTLTISFAYSDYYFQAQQKRLVELTPSDEWDGAGLLGVTIKMDNYGGADERLIRVLEVEEGSPASLAGLVKDKDFMLGTTTTNFSSSRVLASVLELHIDELVEIYVYNSESDMVRVVALMPNYTWGGRGMLGAEVGTGYIHGLPNKCRNTIGQSVERKVRWTGKSTAEADAGDQGESTTPAAAGDNGTFEMEPHLEMELDVDNSEEMTLPESSTKQPHELGTTVTGPVSSQEPVPPTVDPHPVRTQPISTSEAPPPMQPIPSAPAPDTSVQPPSANPTPPMPPPPAGNSTGAASVFAAAPPISNQAANLPPPPIRGEVSPASLAKPTPDGAVYGIPAPPKMTY